MDKQKITLVICGIGIVGGIVGGIIGAAACFARTQYHQGRIDVRREINGELLELINDCKVKYKIKKEEA